MIITGIADEAGKGIDAQIRAHQELGWDHLELRLVDGKNVACALPDTEFEKTAEVIESNAMKVAGFASAIGNWSRNIQDDFSVDVQELKCAAKRMKRFDARYIRIMSWVGEGVSEAEWRKKSIERCRELARIAEGEGVILAHENCEGWGGLSAKHMLALRDEVDSPAFQLLYDIGNTISHGYDPEEFFNVIRHNFDYLHIKDARKNPAGGGSDDYAYCGEGDAMVETILDKVIKEDGYDGFISIEPHVAAIVHLAGQEVSEEDKYASYVKYGRTFMNLLERIRKND